MISCCHHEGPHKINYWPEKKLYYCQHGGSEWTKEEWERAEWEAHYLHAPKQEP